MTSKLINAVEAVRQVTESEISKWTVRRWCRHGLASRSGEGRIRLRYRYVGCRYMTTVEDVIEFFDRVTRDKQIALDVPKDEIAIHRPARPSLRRHYPDWKRGSA